MLPEKIDGLRLRDFLPESQLVLPEHSVERPRFAAIDAHNHLGGVVRQGPDAARHLVDLMDGVGLRAMVNLDASHGNGVSLEDCLRVLKEPYPDRFALFHTLNWKRLEEGEGFGEKMAADLRGAIARGAQGVKIHKSLGLSIRDPQGRLLLPGDERLDPVFATAADVGVPVLFHIADPRAFFQPLDERNERLEQLGRHPDWHFGGPEFPRFEELMEAQVQLVRRHPRTTFISAHVCSYVEDLRWVGELLDACPNLNCDISARY